MRHHLRCLVRVRHCHLTKVTLESIIRLHLLLIEVPILGLVRRLALITYGLVESIKFHIRVLEMGLDIEWHWRLGRHVLLIHVLWNELILRHHSSALAMNRTFLLLLLLLLLLMLQVRLRYKHLICVGKLRVSASHEFHLLPSLS